MKRVILISLFLLSTTFSFSQETKSASVENSVFGIQTGVLGLLRIHNELKLSDQLALRTEVGLADFGIFAKEGGTLSFFTVPSVSLEPRWYYNLDKRASQGKRINGNSGNYISLRASHYFYDISEVEKHNLNHPFLAATWGIRRNIGKHFNYEAGVGAGLGFGYDDGRQIGITPYANLRIGYRF